MIKINNTLVVVTSFIIACTLLYLSFRSGNSAAYLLPKTYTVVLGCLSIIMIFFHFKRKTFFENQIHIKKILPIIFFITFFISVGEDLGFYFSTTLIFFFIATFYSPEAKTLKNIIQSVVWCTLIMCFIYVIFSIMLQVQVPGFILFNLTN